MIGLRFRRRDCGRDVDVGASNARPSSKTLLKSEVGTLISNVWVAYCATLFLRVLLSCNKVRDE